MRFIKERQCFVTGVAAGFLLLQFGCIDATRSPFVGTWSIQNPSEESPDNEKLYITPMGTWNSTGTMRSGIVIENGTYEVRSGVLYLDGTMKSVVFGVGGDFSRKHNAAYRQEGGLLVSINQGGARWVRE